MSETTEKMVLEHKWVELGLGEAPFHCVALISMPSAESFGTNCEGYNNALHEAFRSAKRFGIHGLGSCDACHTGIHNHFIIRDKNGKHFKVGCDCVGKTYDTKLISEVKLAEKRRQKLIRAAKREAEWQFRQQQSLEREAAERLANNGLTLAEIAKSERQSVVDANRERCTSENLWLLKTLDGMNGDFVASMIEKLENNRAADLSDRCLQILSEIYGRTFGRTNSKAFVAAVDEFYSKIEKESA